MREFLKNFYYNSTLGYTLISPFFWLRSQLVPERKLLEQRFKRLLGYQPNIDNPRSLNEKIQWLKLNDRSELHIRCADKYLVREHIINKIGEEYLIPLLLSSSNVEEIKPENIPEYPVIIKSNHSSGGVCIIRDKSKIDWKDVKKDFKRQLNQSYGDGKVEWQYQKIKPRFVIEKLLLDSQGNIPSDYKFHCFNGRVTFIQVDMDRSISHRRNLYDFEWNLLDCTWKYPNGPVESTPKSYEKMVKIAEKLAEDFLYVRVDLYNVNDRIYFGELTFHSESGFGKFVPQKFDYDLGNLLQLPID